MWVAEAQLAERRGWRRQMGAERATDILLCILSAETHTFLRSRRWSQDACRQWYLDVLCHQLFDADDGG